MPSTLPFVLFVCCAAAVAVAQAMILASTLRAWRTRGTAGGAVEWAYALGPVPVLVVLGWGTWQALPR